jgi:hypothetical protein
MNHPDFQTVAVGVHVGLMQCVTVAEPGVVEARAVVINRARAEGDFILAVAVHVAHGEAVRALTFVTGVRTA